jgi:hypothetical protein
MNEQALIRKIEEQATKFKSRAITGQGDQKRHDVVQADEKKSMRTAKERLGWSPYKIGSVFGRDPRTVSSAIETHQSVKRAAQRKPHPDTPHELKMRELAGELRNEISLPGILSSFIVDSS